MIPAMKNQTTFLALAFLLLAGACGKSNKSGGTGAAPGPVVTPVNINVPLPPSASDVDRANYLLAIVNAKRVERGALPLNRDANLDAIALDHARDRANGRRPLHPCSLLREEGVCGRAFYTGSEVPQEAYDFLRTTGNNRVLRSRGFDRAGVAMVYGPMDGVRDPRMVATWVIVLQGR